MAKIRQSNLDNSIVTGLGELTSVASGDQTIIFDASTGTLKKISQNNLLNFPTVSSVSPTSVTSGDGTGNYTFTITGSGFTSGTADLINNSGTVIAFDTVTIDSDTQITGVIAKSSLSGSGEPYDVRVTSTSGLRATLENQINIDQSPTFNTASGSLGNVPDGARTSASFDIEAYDPESAGNVTFEIQSGSLPAGASTTTVHENGVSKFRISGTFSSVGSSTTSTFTIRASDANSNTSSRQFSITVLAPTSESFTSSGTFSVPTGVTLVDVLVVAGGGGGGQQHAGGGGAGGLIFMPAYPVTPGGTIPVTVGCGGAGGCSSPTGGKGSAGQSSVFGTLTALYGGAGGGDPRNTPFQAGGQGGSGGGGVPAGQGLQPTQPGQSGAYGFGNAGGTSTTPSNNPPGAGGGGGGAGAGGSPAPNGCNGGPGGIGKAYTIADGTTPVYYAGGGGGGSHGPSPASRGIGGQGGGGNSGIYAPPIPANSVAQPGTANRGGGGGASASGCVAGGSGGKGIVVVRY